LTASRLVQGGSDADLYRTVSEGRPGSEMPGSGMRPDEVWNVVAYLRSLGAQLRAPLRGDARAGERVFFEESTCASCHRVNGQGGRLGPDLSRIGAARATAALVENIRRPGKDVTRGYETVAVVAKNGERTIGVRKNEDTFSVQLMDVQEKLHLLS